MNSVIDEYEGTKLVGGAIAAETAEDLHVVQVGHKLTADGIVIAVKGSKYNPTIVSASHWVARNPVNRQGWMEGAPRRAVSIPQSAS